MEISVVIPAYNEARRLPPTLERVCTFLSRREVRTGLAGFEVLVVDDGSADATGEAVQAFETRGVRLLTQPENRGKGAALKAGVLESQGRLVLLCDADLSTPIEDLERLEPHLDEAALVLGSRAVADSNVTTHQPLYRELMGKVFNLVIRCLGITGLKDTQCGFKLLTGEAAHRLFPELTVDRFAYDVELIWLARRHGYRVKEVGVTWANSEDSRVSPVVDSVNMFLDIVRFRFRRRPKPEKAEAGR